MDFENPIVLGVVIYLVVINIVAFTAMGIDKKRAIKHAWRIPEKTLFLFAAIGGSIGGIIGMQFFRHKTKHISFVAGFPFILFIQIGILVWLLTK